MNLSKEQIARYSRQLILPEIGVQGQKRLLNSSVLIIGAGGLGSPSALYLAAAGVGHLGIVDCDVISSSNLHRQILYQSADIGRRKSESAQARLSSLNPDLKIEAIQSRIEPSNVMELIQGYDLVLDGSDNFTTRYLVNDASFFSNTPLIYGGVVRFMGQVMVIQPKVSACLRCLFPEPPVSDSIPNCQEAGILGSCAGIIGSVMAHEALKHLFGLPGGLVNRLMVYDGLKSRFRDVVLQRNRDCALCGEAPTIRNLEAIKEQSCFNLQKYPPKADPPLAEEVRGQKSDF